VKAILTWLLLVGLAVVSGARTLEDVAAAPGVSLLNFNWKYAGYERAETVKGNEDISATDTSTAVKLSRKTIYVFKYTAKATLKNTGEKTIKTISWDYVFADAKEQRELKRYRLQSKQRVLPGETQTLVRDIGIDPKENTRHISTGKQSVEIIKLEYADGSAWRRQEKQ
jgi:hypothetical protein